jgi:CDP-paratose 2-epimerase
MRVLITGICGFVGSRLAIAIRENLGEAEVFGFDNFVRPGSELNRLALKRRGIAIHHADLRNASDIEELPAADWVIDAAANPSVLAGVDGQSSSRQVIENNLAGTINILEYCKRHHAGFILLSTSRVYSIADLSSVKVEEIAGAYRPVTDQRFPRGITPSGVAESCSTSPPVSLYGSAKLASEQLALEYGAAFEFPVWIDRCGVLAGAGQFGRADQGILSFWINSWLRHYPLKYIGFDGQGGQVRDFLHPRDLFPLLQRQIAAEPAPCRIWNIGGGIANAMSLAQISAWCADRFGPRAVTSDAHTRPFDIPWMVLDSRRASQDWGWQVATPVEAVLEEIAVHAENHPDWLELSAP